MSVVMHWKNRNIHWINMYQRREETRVPMKYQKSLAGQTLLSAILQEFAESLIATLKRPIELTSIFVSHCTKINFHIIMEVNSVRLCKSCIVYVG